MNNRKPVTRYIPSGMTLRHNDLLSGGFVTNTESSGATTNPNMMASHSTTKNLKKSVLTEQKPVSHTTQSKEKLPKFERECENSTKFADIEASSHSTSVRTRLSREHTVTDINQTMPPPKTICRKNKSFKREKLNHNINQYSVYNVDINKIKISDGHSNGLLEDEKCQTADSMVEASCSNKIEKHFQNKRDDYVQKSAQLQRSKSAILLKYTAKKTKNIISSGRNGLTASICGTDVSRNENVTNLKNLSSNVTKKKLCDCANCDSFVNCVTWCDNNIKFGKSSVMKKGLPLLKTSGTSEKPANIKKICNNNILVHGAFIEKPIESLNNTCFNENIKKAMNNMNCYSAKTLQSYTWPLILRRLNVIMVSPPQSGKTFSYLPAICTFATEKLEKYVELSKYEGPLIIILCLTNEKCEQLKNLIDFVIEESWEDMTAEILNDPAAKANCDILVTMPSTLEESLKSGGVQLKRLCHLVMEDADLLLKNFHESVGNLLKILSKMQINRPHRKNIQVIVGSEKWTLDIENLMKKLYMSPTIIFEDFLEAAAYSDINFNKKKLNSDYKKFCLEDILKKQYSVHRSIVFCQEFEIPEVQEYLEVKGIECISISNDLIEDEIFENEDMWCSLKMGRYKVLLCTDALFDKTVRIMNANWVIHYSLPSDLNIFHKRFRSLMENFSCLFENSKDNCEKPCSFLLGIGDETTKEIFTLFLNILTRTHTKYLQLM